MTMQRNLIGGLIYAAMLAYAFAAIGMLSRNRRAGRALHLVGFLLAAGALVVHSVRVGRPPMANLFDVFLCLGVATYPLAQFCRRYLHVEDGAADALMGLLVLFPVGFVFPAGRGSLPAEYLLAYVIMLKAGVSAFQTLRMPDADGCERCGAETARLVCLGFPLLTLGLVLGSVWGERAWGDYWNWDPKELWGLAMWLVYVAYFHVRRMEAEGARRGSSCVAIAGVGVIVVTVLWVNLSRIFAGLHSYAA